VIKPQVKPKDPRATHSILHCSAKRYEDVIRFIKTNFTGLLITVIFRRVMVYSSVKLNYI